MDGRGQIYSEPLVFANEGTETVKITITKLICNVNSGVTLCEDYVYRMAAAESYPDGIQPADASFEEALESGGPKEAQVFLRNMETEEAVILSEKEIKVEFLLEGGKIVKFEIGGNLTLNPEDGWNMGDIHIQMRFLKEEVGSDTEKPAETERPAEPTEPGEPENPTNPDEPSEPAEPTEPENPSELEEPSEPADI